jgi:hypothetical protein
MPTSAENPKAIAMAVEHADDAQRNILDPNGLADGILVPEKAVDHGAPEQTDPGARSDVRVIEERPPAPPPMTVSKATVHPRPGFPSPS